MSSHCNSAVEAMSWMANTPIVLPLKSLAVRIGEFSATTMREIGWRVVYSAPGATKYSGSPRSCASKIAPVLEIPTSNAPPITPSII